MNFKITSGNFTDTLSELGRQMYENTEMDQKGELYLPESKGKGKLSVHSLRSGFDLFSADELGCKENVKVDFNCGSIKNSLNFTFISAGNPVWKIKNIHSAYKEVSKGALLRVGHANEELFLSNNQSVSFYNVLVKEGFFNYYISNLHESDQESLHLVRDKETSVDYLHLPELGADIRTVIFQMNAHHYQGALKNIYLESKVLELIALFFAQTSRHKPSKKISRSDLDGIYEARDILIRNIENPPTVLELARLTGLNETKLRQGFKQEFNTTIYDYLRKIRMQEAKILMLEKELNVSEAGVAVGYSNISHFARAFKQEFGLNPSELIRYN
jgi:AraC family transcriptional regulator, transcriptional activator of the genes for pyochelin and ferripyochelin receptors